MHGGTINWFDWTHPLFSRSMDLDIEPGWNPGDANMNIEEFRGLVEKRRSTRGYDETAKSLMT